MEEQYDQFPINILETGGRIEREPLGFMVHMVRIWENHFCILNQMMDGVVKGEIVNDEMHITLRGMCLEKYISNNFCFSEISLNKDRILWSNDLFNGGYSPTVNLPAFLSLFYQMGNLCKVQFSNQTYLIEFYGTCVGYDIYEQLMNTFGL
jgi:hypothetical protein